MAVLYSGLGDQRLAEVLSKEVLLLAADRENVINHAVLQRGYAGDATGSGSATIKMSQLAFFGADLTASVAENTDASEPSIADGSVTVTVGRYAKKTTVSDLARITDSQGILTDPAQFALDAVLANNNKLMAMIATAGATATKSAGTTITSLSAATIRAAAGKLEVDGYRGPYLCILAPQQYLHFQADIEANAGGAAQWHPATADQLAIRGGQFKGSYFGIDIFTSSQMTKANADVDYVGLMVAPGGIAWADATIPANPASDAIYAGKVMVGIERNESKAVTAYVVNAYQGAALGIDNAVCKVISKVAA
jgi:hypothetical protein